MDIPTHNTANYGIPVYPYFRTCAGNPVKMNMNYMGYTDDKGMYMFALNKKKRMDAIFLAGGVRVSFRT